MKLTIEQALQQAVEAYKTGKLQDAEALYRAVLRAQPKHPDANHNLGVVEVSLNKTEAALPLFKVALEANPNRGQFWLSYVDALIKEKQFDNARNVLEQGKKRGLAGEEVDVLEVQLVQLHVNLKSQKTEPNKLSKAIQLREMGRYQEAQDWLTKFLEVEPTDAEGWSLLSQLFLLDQKDVQAEKAIATAILINPNLPSIYRNQARLLLKNSKPAEALVKAQSGFEKSTEDPESWIVLATCLGANQRDLEALPLIERALKARPNYAEAFASKGLVRLRAKNTSGAIEDFEKAGALKPHLTQIWELLGTLRYQDKNLSGAIEALKKAQALEPDNVNRMITLGEFLRQDQRIEEAIAILEEVTEKAPENANAWINLGTALQQDNKIENAQIAYKKALVIQPNLAEVCNNLGSIAKDIEDWESARKYFEQAITIKPDLAEAHSNLGVTLQELGRLQEAEASYSKAIAIKPEFAEAHSNLGNTLKELGRLEDAFVAVTKSIKIKPTIEAKNLFMYLTKRIGIQPWYQSLAQLVITALLEPWGRPSDLMSFACRLLRVDKELVNILNQSQDDDSRSNYNESFLGSISKKEFFASSLLGAMLSSSPIPDPEIEIFLTSLRRHLLKVAVAVTFKKDETEEVAALYCALAQQCFINEYVYFQTPEEIKRSHQLLNQLTRALKDKQSIPAVWVISVACYFPLYSVEGAEKLLHQKWSDDVNSVFKQQIQDPLEELNLRASIGVITSIENQVSLAVQSQYEENPYPRWMRLPKDSSKKFLNTYIQSKFPLSLFRRLADDSNPEILIAGCGTGQHSIGTSQLLKGVRILAVDLSIASLAYAKRKTTELNIEFIEYAQADLLKLSSLGRTFDVIESAGVLHHLENPFEGWEILLSLLRPNGLMRLGFYSELARRDIVRVRNLISEGGIGSTSQEIRDYRKHLLGLKDFENYGFATSSSDFFSTSACRDLLFHIQEHRMNLKVLADFFKNHDLNFLGFDIDSSVIRAYKNRFPNDPSATNLDQWRIYEQENPDTFIGMYQFWVQKIST